MRSFFYNRRAPPSGGERSNAAARTAVRRRGSVTRAPRSRARLLSVTTRRRLVAQPRTPHLHCAARAVLQAQSPQCRGSRGTPLAFLWGFQKGYSLRKENTPFGWQQRPALHCKPARSAENTLRPHRAEARMQRITLQCSNPPPVRRRSPRTAPWRRARQTARSWRPWRFRAACR